MSRAAGGTYTLPAGNPVVTGTIISSTWGNTTLSDIATALTDSLSRSGLGGMTAPLLVADGTQALPAYSWTNEPSSGFYRIGAGNIGLSVLNRLTWNVTSAGNMTLAAPSSGTTLSIGGTTALALTTAGASLAFSDTSASAQDINFNTSGSFELVSRTAGGNFNLYVGAVRLALSIAAAGNVAIAAPSSGTVLALGGIAATATTGLSLTGSTTGLSQFVITSTAGSLKLGTESSVGAAIATGTSGYDSVLTTANATQLWLGTNGVARLGFSTSGNATLNAPSSGVALTLTGVSGSSPLTVNNSGATVASAVQLYEPLFSAAAVKTAATYETGTFTGTLTGCTTSPTTTVNYTRVGNVVTLDFCGSGALIATSNTTACTITGLPAALTPARTESIMMGNLQDNSVAGLIGLAQISGTTIALAICAVSGARVAPNGTGFTAAGTKGVSASTTLTYPLT